MSGEDHVATARAVYDKSAPRYLQLVGTEISSATEGPIDRALLVAFIELIKRQALVRVADIGCGPGRVAALMAEHGLEVVGVDVSQAMLAVARTAHPHIKFEEGQLDALPIESGVLAGAVCWYSIIYTPPDRLAEAFGELRRVLMPGGTHSLPFKRRANRYTVQTRKVHTYHSRATGMVCWRLQLVWRTPASRSTPRVSGNLNWNTKPPSRDSSLPVVPPSRSYRLRAPRPGVRGRSLMLLLDCSYGSAGLLRNPWVSRPSAPKRKCACHSRS
jgi:ubiquinone/menaquinone biosynthesis C-methylase UbiE